MFSFPDLGDNTGESVALYDGVHHLLDPQLAPLHQPVQTTGQHITQQVRALPQQAIFHTMKATACPSCNKHGDGLCLKLIYKINFEAVFPDLS